MLLEFDKYLKDNQIIVTINKMKKKNKKQYKLSNTIYNGRIKHGSNMKLQ